MQTSGSDDRLLCILQGSERFRRHLDGSGLTRLCSAVRLSLQSQPAGGDVWTLVLAGPSGCRLRLRGRLSQSDVTVITDAMFIDGELRMSLPVVFSESLSEAFGPLAQLPSDVLLNLSPPAASADGEGGAFSLSALRRFCMEALLHGLDSAHGLPLAGFGSLVLDVEFSDEDSGVPVSVTLTARREKAPALERLTAVTDIYGISGKHVWFDTVLSGGGNVSCDCFIVRDGYRIPSLAVAARVARALASDGGGEADERTVALHRGVPRCM